MRAAVAAIWVLALTTSGCDSSSIQDESTQPTAELTTLTTNRSVTTPPSTSEPTTAPETEPAQRSLTGFSWEATWPGHRIASDITISVDDRSVAAFFGETQHGQLTELGVAEIQRLVDQMRLGETPETFAGTVRWTWADESTFTITLMVGGEQRTYRYTGSPPPQLSALDDFLWSQVLPLSGCESTYAVEVVEPCTFLGVD